MELKYPVGIQDFRTLIEGGNVYVDKTERIYRILQRGSYYFLARPRRFGKSLLIATLKELYSGSAELFEGLWIAGHWDFAQQDRPVIWLKFALSGEKAVGLEAAILALLNGEARRLGLTLPRQTVEYALVDLIEGASKLTGKRIVLLIDEYDKPIIDHLDDLGRVETNRSILKRFYSGIKDSGSHLELVFITGVTAFAKVSIFSDLNNLRNLSLAREANSLVGITEAELDRYFSEPLAQFDRGLVRRWYNGYSWTGEERVYNPWSLFNFLLDGRFGNYWFATGTPTFLIHQLRSRNDYDVSRTKAYEPQLLSFIPEALDPIVVMFQTGYLTVVDYDPMRQAYTLDFPNLEVNQALRQALLNSYVERSTTNISPTVLPLKLEESLQIGDIEQGIHLLNGLFADLPYDTWRNNHEAIYHAVIHLVFSILGIYVRSEVHSANGRADVVLEMDDYIYVLEFKLDQPVAIALQQIEARDYFGPFAADPRRKIGVGISFSSEQKAIVDWQIVDY